MMLLYKGYGDISEEVTLKEMFKMDASIGLESAVESGQWLKKKCNGPETWAQTWTNKEATMFGWAEREVWDAEVRRQ